MARTKTVLLVTKPGLVRNITSAGLTLYGYDVLTAAPEEAIESLQVNRHTAVLVIDADLSDQDEGVARFARAVNPKIDVVYTSRMPIELRPHCCPALQFFGTLTIRTNLRMSSLT